MDQILPTVNHLASMIPWDLVAASGLLSPLLVGVKAWLKVQSERVMMTLVLIFGIIGATITYLTSPNITDPSTIAVHGLMISAMSQPVFFLIVKPAYTWFAGELAKARAFDAEVKSAAIPAEGLPTGTTQP